MEQPSERFRKKYFELGREEGKRQAAVMVLNELQFLAEAADVELALDEAIQSYQAKVFGASGSTNPGQPDRDDADLALARIEREQAAEAAAERKQSAGDLVARTAKAMGL